MRQFSFAIFLLCCTVLNTQSDDEFGKQLWIDYNTVRDIKDDLTGFLELGGRTVTPREWNRVYVRASVFKHIIELENKSRKLIEVHGGLGWFTTFSINQATLYEIRPFQGFRLNYPNFKRIRFNNYTRLEQRWQFQVNGPENSFQFRFRNKLTVIIILVKKENGMSIGIPFSVEPFVNIGDLNDSFTDQLRVWSGLKYRVNKRWKFTAQIMFQQERDELSNKFELDNITFRLRINHDIGKRGFLRSKEVEEY